METIVVLKITREEMISELQEYHSNGAMLMDKDNLFHKGFKGIDNMTDKEVLELYKATLSFHGDLPTDFSDMPNCDLIDSLVVAASPKKKKRR